MPLMSIMTRLSMWQILLLCKRGLQNRQQPPFRWTGKRRKATAPTATSQLINIFPTKISKNYQLSTLPNFSVSSTYRSQFQKVTTGLWFCKLTTYWRLKPNTIWPQVTCLIRPYQPHRRWHWRMWTSPTDRLRSKPTYPSCHAIYLDTNSP